MFTHWQKYQIKLIETGFFYLPPFPLSFDTKKVQACQLSSKVSPKFISFTVASLLFGIVGLLFEIPCLHGMSSEKKIDGARMILQFQCFLCVAVTTILIKCSSKIKETICGINSLYSLKDKLDRGMSSLFEIDCFNVLLRICIIFRN